MQTGAENRGCWRNSQKSPFKRLFGLIRSCQTWTFISVLTTRALYTVCLTCCTNSLASLFLLLVKTWTATMWSAFGEVSYYAKQHSSATPLKLDQNISHQEKTVLRLFWENVLRSHRLLSHWYRQAPYNELWFFGLKRLFLQGLPGTFFVQEADILTWFFPVLVSRTPEAQKLKKKVGDVFFPEAIFSSQKSREQRGWHSEAKILWIDPCLKPFCVARLWPDLHRNELGS